MFRYGPPRSSNFPGFAKQCDRDFLLFSGDRIAGRKLLRFARQICDPKALIEKRIVPDVDANGKFVPDGIADRHQPVRQPVP